MSNNFHSMLKKVSYRKEITPKQSISSQLRQETIIDHDDIEMLDECDLEIISILSASQFIHKNHENNIDEEENGFYYYFSERSKCPDLLL